MEDTQLQKKLSDLKAQRALKEAEREAKAQAIALAKEVEREELELQNLETLEKLEAEHGEDRIACTYLRDGRMIVVRAPTRAEFKKMQAGKGKGHEDIESLVSQCRLYPDVDTFNKMKDQYPGIITPLAKAMTVLSGADQELAEKK